jgi:hypothetical protein
MNVCGESTRFARKGSGSDSRSSGKGGEAYTVVSSVIRRMSHFLRLEVSASGVYDDGGCRIEKAELSSECVRGTSR